MRVAGGHGDGVAAPGQEEREMVFGIVRRAALIAGLGVGLATLLALPAFAQGPIQLSSTPIAESPAWKSYVLGDGASQTSPVRISSTSGAVTNAQGLVDPSKGPARLTWDGTGLAPLILLDYGREVGGGMRIDTGGTTESVTVTNVGTQGRNTTLAAAAAAGATNIKVASVTGMSAGDTIHVDTGAARETRPIASVGTSGANGTGITLTAPLAEAHPAGAPVRGITGSLTGDRNGFNGVGVDPSRANSFTLTAPGTVGNAPDQIQGGQRFQAITLTTPGTVELTSVGIHFRHPNASSDDYAGYFLSSDDALNRIWYQGAYTNDTDMVPIGAVPNQTIPVILDGAKRDRRPWIGDLLVQGRTAFNSLGFGAKGSDYIKGPIRLFGASQAANGSVFGHIQNWTTIPPGGGFYSLSYSMYFVLDLASYYLYSGDAEFVKSQYQIMKNELAYNRALVDPTSGLLISGAGERDWDFYDGGKPGAVTAYNAIYYKALSDAARLASDLAERYSDDPAAATWRADAATWSSQAADLKSRINATLFDTSRGVYKLADRDNANHAGSSVPQDGNSNAINFGIAPASAHAGILDYLRDNLWGTFGPQPYSPDANYSTVISPFVTGMEVDARFAAGDTDGALDLIHLMWDQMTDESGPYYTATLWEKLNQDGTDVDANASLSHGWASGPVSSLSGYLLGARPVTAGYQTWIVEPHPGGDVEWAQGRIPTPSGPIVSRWRRGDGNRSFTLTMAAPEGTSGTVVVPLLGRSQPIAMDGRVVWPKRDPTADVRAEERDGAVHFSGITGSHTFAWGHVDRQDCRQHERIRWATG